jgi:hypothetical protein
MTSRSLRRAFLSLAVFGLLAARVATAADAPPPTSASQPLGGKQVDAKVVPGQPRTIGWDELVPKGWDPMKQFKDVDLSQLDDSDPRANDMLMKLQDAFDHAPVNSAMNGVEVKIPGFVVPLEEDQGTVTEFLLVPYFGACIHTPPPPANQILHVQPKQAAKFRSMDTVWVTGKLQTVHNESTMGVSGYHITADSVTRYTPDKSAKP